jgi:regulatory protein
VRGAALKLLSRRDLTRAELTARLLDRGYLGDDVEPAVTRLAGERFLDDRRTALAHARTSSKIKGRGRVRIGRELEARGVSKDLIREALNQISPDEDLETIRRFLRRKGVTALPAPAERRRLFQQLVRRGFSIDLVSKALRYRPDEE